MNETVVVEDPGDRQNVTVTIIRRSIAPSHAVIVPSVTKKQVTKTGD